MKNAGFPGERSGVGMSGLHYPLTIPLAPGPWCWRLSFFLLHKEESKSQAQFPQKKNNSYDLTQMLTSVLGHRLCPSSPLYLPRILKLLEKAARELILCSW